ncbi:non-specific serine,threonine protein kinase [Sarracenia purpurea var. burkii]
MDGRRQLLRRLIYMIILKNMLGFTLTSAQPKFLDQFCDPRIFVWSLDNVTTNVYQFTQTATTLLNNLRVQAASGGALRKYASGSSNENGGGGANSQTVYGLVQCTPDISERDCSDCLQVAIDNFPLCCIVEGTGVGRVIRGGGRVIRPSCNFRYESTGRFFTDIDLPPSASPAPGVASLLLLTVFFFFLFLLLFNLQVPKLNISIVSIGQIEIEIRLKFVTSSDRSSQLANLT